MLILKRRRGQSVKIGPDVVVQIISIEQGAVTLGIDAPAELKIRRESPQAEGTDRATEDRV